MGRNADVSAANLPLDFPSFSTQASGFQTDTLYPPQPSVRIVFGTTERRVFRDAAWRDRLHSYLGGIVRESGGVADAVGGVADHVHVLASLRATHRLADVVRDLKKTSCACVHQEIRMPTFS